MLAVNSKENIALVRAYYGLKRLQEHDMALKLEAFFGIFKYFKDKKEDPWINLVKKSFPFLENRPNKNLTYKEFFSKKKKNLIKEGNPKKDLIQKLKEKHRHHLDMSPNEFSDYVKKMKKITKTL